MTFSEIPLASSDAFSRFISLQARGYRVLVFGLLDPYEPIYEINPWKTKRESVALSSINPATATVSQMKEDPLRYRVVTPAGGFLITVLD